MQTEIDLTSEPARRTTWWSTIFEPGWSALVTCVSLVVFVALVILGGILGEYRLWFHIPAAVGIMTWYTVMMKRYRTDRKG